MFYVLILIRKHVFGYDNIYLLYNDKWLTSVDKHTSNAIFSIAKGEIVNLFWAITTLESRTHRASFH